jgi:hypothetical protein
LVIGFIYMTINLHQLGRGQNIETLVKWDPIFGGPTANTRTPRVAVGYIEHIFLGDNITKEVYLSVYGSGEDGAQVSGSYKIQMTNTGECIVYQGSINPEQWDLIIAANQENNINIKLRNEELTNFNSIGNELSKYLIHQPELSGDDSCCSMLPADKVISGSDHLMTSENFDTSYLTVLKKIDWPF